MKTIGIIGAMDEEIIYIKERMDIITAKNVIGLDFFVGRMFGKNVVIVRSGIGKVNAAICAQVLVDHFAVDYIVNVGVAGAVYKELNIGDIVISSDAVQHDVDTTVFGDPIGVIPRMLESYFKADEELIKIAQEASTALSSNAKTFIGRIASGDQFISSTEEKARIWNTVGGYCAEMEGAAIAQTCYLNKIPFVVIRSISDNADNKATVSYEEFVPIAAKNSGELVEKILEVI